VIVHVLPEQLKAGKIVRAPMELPWVEETAGEIFRIKLRKVRNLMADLRRGIPSSLQWIPDAS
jgi:hypothetical protein